MKYTREDVIITREQAEKAGLKIGSICYVGDRISACLEWANNNEHTRKIDSIDWDSPSPFRDEKHGLWWDCVIIKKEPEKKIVPFDFSLKEDRDALIGRRIISTCSDFIVNGFAFWPKQGWMLQLDSEFGYSSDYVFENFVFADTGKPVGKEVTE